MQGWEEEESDSQTAQAESRLLQSLAWQRVASLHSMSEPEESLARGGGGISLLPEPARDALCRLAATSFPQVPFSQLQFPLHITSTPRTSRISALHPSRLYYLRSFISY